MNAAETLFLGYGIWVLPALIFAGGLGLPLPATPILLAAGALAGSGRLPLAGVLAGSVTGLFAADVVWYQLGRWRGRQVLALFGGISPEPGSFARRAERLFARHQRMALVVSKFVPGLKAVAPLLAGTRTMAPVAFALYDGIGSLLWLGALVASGWVFNGQVARLAAAAGRLGGFVALAAGIGFAAWLGWKVVARLRSERATDLAAITPYGEAA